MSIEEQFIDLEKCIQKNNVEDAELNMAILNIGISTCTKEEKEKYKRRLGELKTRLYNKRNSASTSTGTTNTESSGGQQSEIEYPTFPKKKGWFSCCGGNTM